MKKSLSIRAIVMALFVSIVGGGVLLTSCDNPSVPAYYEDQVVQLDTPVIDGFAIYGANVVYWTAVDCAKYELLIDGAPVDLPDGETRYIDTNVANGVEKTYSVIAKVANNTSVRQVYFTSSKEAVKTIKGKAADVGTNAFDVDNYRNEFGIDDATGISNNVTATIDENGWYVIEFPAKKWAKYQIAALGENEYDAASCSFNGTSHNPDLRGDDSYKAKVKIPVLGAGEKEIYIKAEGYSNKANIDSEVLKTGVKVTAAGFPGNAGSLESAEYIDAGKTVRLTIWPASAASGIVDKAAYTIYRYANGAWGKISADIKEVTDAQNPLTKKYIVDDVVPDNKVPYEYKVVIKVPNSQTVGEGDNAVTTSKDCFAAVTGNGHVAPYSAPTGYIYDDIGVVQFIADADGIPNDFRFTYAKENKPYDPLEVTVYIGDKNAAYEGDFKAYAMTYESKRGVFSYVAKNIEEGEYKYYISSKDKAGKVSNSYPTTNEVDYNNYNTVDVNVNTPSVTQYIADKDGLKNDLKISVQLYTNGRYTEIKSLKEGDKVTFSYAPLVSNGVYGDWADVEVAYSESDNAFVGYAKDLADGKYQYVATYTTKLADGVVIEKSSSPSYITVTAESNNRKDWGVSVEADTKNADKDGKYNDVKFAVSFYGGNNGWVDYNKAQLDAVSADAKLYYGEKRNDQDIGEYTEVELAWDETQNKWVGSAKDLADGSYIVYATVETTDKATGVVTTWVGKYDPLTINTVNTNVYDAFVSPAAYNKDADGVKNDYYFIVRSYNVPEKAYASAAVTLHYGVQDAYGNVPAWKDVPLKYSDRGNDKCFYGTVDNIGKVGDKVSYYVDGKATDPDTKDEYTINQYSYSMLIVSSDMDSNLSVTANQYSTNSKDIYINLIDIYDSEKDAIANYTYKVEYAPILTINGENELGAGEYKTATVGDWTETASGKYHQNIKVSLTELTENTTYIVKATKTSKKDAANVQVNYDTVTMWVSSKAVVHTPSLSSYWYYPSGSSVPAGFTLNLSGDLSDVGSWTVYRAEEMDFDSYKLENFKKVNTIKVEKVSGADYAIGSFDDRVDADKYYAYFVVGKGTGSVNVFSDIVHAFYTK